MKQLSALRFHHQIFVLTFVALFNFKSGVSQSCSALNFQIESEVSSTCNQMVMTMEHDKMDRPYLYVANKEAGLVVLNIADPSNPIAVDTISISSLDSLEVMNLYQSGYLVYLALGNHFTNPQPGGMAIIDVTNPASCIVKDVYVIPGSNSGAGDVFVEGDYAYLGGMKSGLIILDVSDLSNIVEISTFMPDINYPVLNPNANLYNARGMEVVNGIVYLAFDAGGLRIINCTNPQQPRETGRYANPATYVPINRPRAYNHLVVDGTMVYITTDYCGFEVLNVSDTSNITLTGWWNPYDCPNNNWFSSPSHTNEIYYNAACQQVFLSTGKSDLMVIDVSNPAAPDSCNYFGGVNNGIGTWGVSGYADQIYLSYICAAIPFTSNWTGLKLLSYTPCNGSGLLENLSDAVSIFPNPASNHLLIQTPNPSQITNITLISATGQMHRVIFDKQDEFLRVSLEGIPAGFYCLQIGYPEGNRTVSVVLAGD